MDPSANVSSAAMGVSRVRRIAQNLLLATTAMAALFVVLEITARLAGFEPIYAVYSKPSLFWRHDPLLGWSHEPGARGEYVGPRPWPIEFRAPVEINSAGLRGPEIPEPEPEGVRILMLGDSLVVGFEVGYQDTFVALTAERLRRELHTPVQVINAGVRGYGTDQSLIYFREHGKALAPDLVLYALSDNDPENNITLHRMRRPFGKAAFRLEPDGELSLVGHPIPDYPICSSWALDNDYQPTRLDGLPSRSACWLQTRLSDHSALFSFITLRVRRSPTLLRLLYGLGTPEEIARTRFDRPPQLASALPLGAVFLSFVRHGSVPTDTTSPPASHAWALTSALIREMARESEAIGARFVLLIHPDDWNSLDGELLLREGILPSYVLLTGGEAANKAVRFRNDSHLNESGHDLMARGITDLLIPMLEEHRRKPRRKRRQQTER